MLLQNKRLALCFADLELSSPNFFFLWFRFSGVSALRIYSWLIFGIGI